MSGRNRHGAARECVRSNACVIRTHGLFLFPVLSTGQAGGAGRTTTGACGFSARSALRTPAAPLSPPLSVAPSEHCS